MTAWQHSGWNESTLISIQEEWMARGDVYWCYFSASQIKPVQLTTHINLPVASRSSTNGLLLSLDKQLLFFCYYLGKILERAWYITPSDEYKISHSTFPANERRKPALWQRTSQLQPWDSVQESQWSDVCRSQTLGPKWALWRKHCRSITNVARIFIWKEHEIRFYLSPNHMLMCVSDYTQWHHVELFYLWWYLEITLYWRKGWPLCWYLSCCWDNIPDRDNFRWGTIALGSQPWRCLSITARGVEKRTLTCWQVREWGGACQSLPALSFPICSSKAQGPWEGATHSQSGFFSPKLTRSRNVLTDTAVPCLSNSLGDSKSSQQWKLVIIPLSWKLKYQIVDGVWIRLNSCSGKASFWHILWSLWYAVSLPFNMDVFAG